jgi:uncharacterized membrane protein YkvA (DUF1232 family)
MSMTATKSLRWGVLRSLATAFRTALRPGSPGVGARLTSLPRLVRATVKGDYAGTSGRRLLAIVGALLYVVSPVDLVPEILLPFLGLADDALVVTWIVTSLINETESFLRWEHDRHRTIRADLVP